MISIEILRGIHLDIVIIIFSTENISNQKIQRTLDRKLFVGKHMIYRFIERGDP